jgi:CD109 antigen
MTVKSQPLSYVGILGVDQSVLLLKAGNDISHEMVKNELMEYSIPNQWNYEWFENSTYKFYSDFSVSSSIILTNALEEYRKCTLISLNLKIYFSLLLIK